MSVREVKHTTFTSLVMSLTGGMDNVVTIFYKRLALMMSDKRDILYGKTVNWIYCCFSFAHIRASVMSIRGTRSSQHHPASEGEQRPIDLQLAECHI